HKLNGKLTGNIVLTDKAPNLIGIITIARWMLTGKKKKILGLFPKPGVSNKDINEASRFGQLIVDALLKNEMFDLTQNELDAQGATIRNNTLMTMEKRVSRIFNIWAGFILKKGGAGDRRRKNRIWGFYIYLCFVIIFIVPLISIFAPLIRVFRKRTTNNVF
ncbi:MAG: dialkylresorcinol condensing enzyme DarA, partial [Crocinitomicaceae bacterium]|nr:dialkylresorcinol condensing enzyme DarA [Crocinitomicaceae bacterium]